MNLAMDICPFKAFARGREAAGVSVTKRLHAWWEGYDLPDSDDAAETSPVDEPLEEISIDGDETPLGWSGKSRDEQGSAAVDSLGRRQRRNSR